jgi:hypothetical protein
VAQFVSWRSLYERSGLAARPSCALTTSDIAVLVELLTPLLSRALYSKV